MNNTKLYYTPPSDRAFKEMKYCALNLWCAFTDDPDYLAEKTRIKTWDNISGNFMAIFAMFDPNNQNKLCSMLSLKTKKELKDRLIDGGTPIAYIPYNL